MAARVRGRRERGIIYWSQGFRGRVSRELGPLDVGRVKRTYLWAFLPTSDSALGSLPGSLMAHCRGTRLVLGLISSTKIWYFAVRQINFPKILVSKTEGVRMAVKRQGEHPQTLHTQSACAFSPSFHLKNESRILQLIEIQTPCQVKVNCCACLSAFFITRFS